MLWEGRGERVGVEEGKDERMWAENEFLGGRRRQKVGKLGALLGGYEEEREAERIREVRRGDLSQRMQEHSLEDNEEEEEEEEEEGGEDDEDGDSGVDEPLTPAQLQSNFERLVRERFIYGLLDVGDILS